MMTRLTQGSEYRDYIREKETERERKIKEFEQAIERQGRSMQKLMEGEGGGGGGGVAKEASVLYIDVREGNSHYSPMKQLSFPSPIPHPLAYQQSPRNHHYNHEMDYLQSSHYEKYLQQILSNTASKDNARKIEVIRSNNIYLQNHFGKDRQGRDLLEVRLKEQLKNYYNPQHQQQVYNYSRKSNKEAQVPLRQITCLPYLEDSSVLQPIDEEKHSEQSGVSTSPTYWNQPTKNITVFQKSVQQDTFNERKSFNHLQNVKTIVKGERSQTQISEKALRPSLQLNTQAKRERNMFIENMLKRQKQNKQLFPYRGQQNRNSHAAKYQRNNRQHIDARIALKRQEVPRMSERPLFNKRSTSFTQDSSKKQSLAPRESQYSIEFKLQKPDENSRKIARSASAIGFTEDRSYQAITRPRYKHS